MSPGQRPPEKPTPQKELREGQEGRAEGDAAGESTALGRCLQDQGSAVAVAEGLVAQRPSGSQGPGHQLVIKASTLLGMGAVGRRC